MTATLLVDADTLLPDIVELRRSIHREPELGLFTPTTMAKVRTALAGLPLEWREGPSSSGLVAILRGSGAGKTVLLRGDTDALPMQEHTGLDYASTVAGAMHACGHDSHTAMLAGAARLLCARREALSGTILFMFQPGEEGHHGARFMIDDGLLDPLPDAAFALHVLPNARFGVFASRVGPLLASSDRIEIVIEGRGGHASTPSDTFDPIPTACEIVLAIQTMVTRRINIFDPAVVTIAQIEGGSTDNVIPDHVTLRGTMRTLSSETRKTVKAQIRQIAENIAIAHGMAARITITEGFPVTRCDASAVALAEAAICTVFGPDNWQTMPHPIMGAEDFAYVLEQTPGAMLFLGAAHEGEDWSSCCALHSSRMVLDERVMTRGIAAHVALAEQFLAGSVQLT